MAPSTASGKGSEVPDISSAETAVSDGDLLPRLASGDRDALRMLFNRYRTPVYWVAFRVVHSRTDAEDIVQDSFITLWEKRAQITLLGDSFLPWLATTAKYKALNRLRAARRNEMAPLDDGSQSGASLAVSPEAAAAAEEFARNLSVLIASLPMVDQQLFQLCFVEDLTYKEAAVRLGISHASIRNRLPRLKNRLRAEIQLLRGGR